jgi:hypothetical protein
LGVPIFDNIAASELTHTQTVLALLERYNLPDPSANLGAGEFSNSYFQDLYRQFTERGSLSLSEALKVGGAIEEIDIRDLDGTFTHTTQPDILQVYNNLQQGSFNHLNAFVNNLYQQSGETYQPQYLSAEEYQAILGNAGNGGMGYGMQNNGIQNNNGMQNYSQGRFNGFREIILIADKMTSREWQQLLPLAFSVQSVSRGNRSSKQAK